MPKYQLIKAPYQVSGLPRTALHATRLGLFSKNMNGRSHLPCLLDAGATNDDLLRVFFGYERIIGGPETRCTPIAREAPVRIQTAFISTKSATSWLAQWKITVHQMNRQDYVAISKTPFLKAPSEFFSVCLLDWHYNDTNR